MAPKAEELARACAEQLAYHKVPGYFAFVEHLPTTATQKLQRAEIRRLAQSALQHPATVDVRTLKGQLRLAKSA
jgi:acyl-coenzyme A synthetase/AMP-(fatty) acid ligase